MCARQRVTLRLDVEVDSVEGRLFAYLKGEPAVSLRESVLRALKVFYLPWALEPDLGPSELQSLAQTLLEDMQLRSLQLQSRFFAIDETPPLGMAQSSEPAPHPVVPRAHDDGADDELIRHQYLQLHQAHRYCSVRSSPGDDWVDLSLSALGFDLLAKLIQQPGRVYTRSELLKEVWGPNHTGDIHSTVDPCVRRLRQEIRSKLRVPEGVNPLAKTMRGVGYKFEDVNDWADMISNI